MYSESMSRTHPNPLGKTSRLPSGFLATGTVARLAGLDPVTLRRWIERGAVHPRRIGKGKGAVLAWTVGDLIAARVVAVLRMRLSTQAIRGIVRELRRWGRDFSSAVLVQSGRDAYHVVNRADLMNVLNQPGQGALVFVVLAPVLEVLRSRAKHEGIALREAA